MAKKQTVVALALLILIPMVLMLGGLLFSLINPEIAAGVRRGDRSDVPGGSSLSDSACRIQHRGSSSGDNGVTQSTLSFEPLGTRTV